MLVTSVVGLMLLKGTVQRASAHTRELTSKGMSVIKVSYAMHCQSKVTSCQTVVQRHSGLALVSSG